MSNDNLAAKIFKEIKEKNIQPKSRWEFILKDYSKWSLLAFILLIGSLATSVIIYMIHNNDWDLYSQAGHSFSIFILATLPYFWLIVLILLLILLYFYFKDTKSGYKYHAYSIIICSILGSVFLGLFLYDFGLAQAIDEVFNEHLPFYQKFANPKERFLNQPAKGILPGRIIEIIDPNDFKIVDPSEKEWLIIIENNLPVREILRPRARIIILGQEIDANTFRAELIRPIMPQNGLWFKYRIPGLLNRLDERNYFFMRINI
jgi:uncharacterized membrane protein